MQVTYFLNGLMVNCCFIVILLFTFVFNAKSLAIAILVFFLFFLLVPFSGRTTKRFLATFCHLITRKRVTKIGPILLDTTKQVCATNVFQDAICDACHPWIAMCFTYSG